MYITDDNADRIIAMTNTEITQILNEGKLTKEIVCLLGEMVDILKDIKELDEAEDGGMSQGMSYDMVNASYGRGGMGNSYNSYAPAMSMRRYGRSRGTDRDAIMSKLQNHMNQASSEQERETIRRIMNSI